MDFPLFIVSEDKRKWQVTCFVFLLFLTSIFVKFNIISTEQSILEKQEPFLSYCLGHPSGLGTRKLPIKVQRIFQKFKCQTCKTALVEK